MEYYNNSNKARQEEHVEKKDIQKVVTGEVVTQKKGPVKKFFSTFFEEDIHDVGTYIRTKVVIPYVKNILSEAFNTLLYGESGKTATSGLNQRASYTRYYEDRNRGITAKPAQNESSGSYETETLIFKSYTDCDNVLRNLKDIAVDYPYASVGDYKMLIGESTIPTDYSWGWDGVTLDDAQIMRARDGYFIKLPKVLRIK